MASRKSAKYLAKDVGEFALHVREAVKDTVPVEPQHLTKPVVKAFRDAYSRGGLDEVDKLIDSINKQLLSDGATCGLADGCACEQGNDGEPDALCIRFKEYDARSPYFMQWIELN